MREVTWNENVIAADDRRQHRLLAPGPAPAAPEALGRAPALSRRRARPSGAACCRARETPHVINPEQGWLANWNNLPSAGWTNGDARGARAAHRAASPRPHPAVAGREGRAATRATRRSTAIVETSGTTAQQFPFVDRRKLDARGEAAARRRRRARSRALLAWDGDYATRRRRRDGRPGRRDLGGVQGPARGDPADADAAPRRAPTSPAAPAARTSSTSPTASRWRCGRSARAPTRGPRSATAAALTDALRHRRPRAPGASRAGCTRSRPRAPPPSPDLPFFDRGTWNQSVALGR